MKFKTLLFDVDDTLLDFQATEKKHYKPFLKKKR